MEGLNKKYQVVLDRCPDYQSFSRKGYLETLISYIDELPDMYSRRVLLKPNLVSAHAPKHGCTDARFIRAVAICLKNKGAKVLLGDSPAFGSALSVCKAQGIRAALADLDVSIVDFQTKVPVKLDCGIEVNFAKDALDCDLLVNLPKIKAHSQMYMTLAVKNCFGLVVGMQKGILHMKHGKGYELFSKLIVDIQQYIPSQLIIGDGIEAMHLTGPIKGKRLDLGLVAVATNPFAFDTAILSSLQLPHDKSPLWSEADARKLPSNDVNNISYPMLDPVSFSQINFKTPDELIPIRFNPFRFLKGMIRRLTVKKK